MQTTPAVEAAWRDRFYLIPRLNTSMRDRRSKLSAIARRRRSEDAFLDGGYVGILAQLRAVVRRWLLALAAAAKRLECREN
jgi:hypothetical protein